MKIFPIICSLLFFVSFVRTSTVPQKHLDGRSSRVLQVDETQDFPNNITLKRVEGVSNCWINEKGEIFKLVKHDNQTAVESSNPEKSLLNQEIVSAPLTSNQYLRSYLSEKASNDNNRWQPAFRSYSHQGGCPLSEARNLRADLEANRHGKTFWPFTSFYDPYPYPPPPPPPFYPPPFGPPPPPPGPYGPYGPW